MKVTVTKSCQIPAEHIFSILKESLRKDFQQNTDKLLLDFELKEGLTYIKHFGTNHQNSVRVLVTEFQENQSYKAEFRTTRGSQIISYEIVPKDSNTNCLILSQEIKSKALLQRLNDYIMSIFFRKSLERKLSAQLLALINNANSN